MSFKDIVYIIRFYGNEFDIWELDKWIHTSGFSKFEGYNNAQVMDGYNNPFVPCKKAKYT